ncbi:ABC transporter ATP-binding protein [Dehalobacterium formicoaceticum]|uniref:ATP-binding cassette domain-containing protein n=1 Tax=Dehalobacterium formicoaceticum TaxID=51515 RepID=A0ABT1Y7L6_9FIRM|nr:ATP-binding cassette domain-containing protein [Dehalobacterium formicoaceticum]MCR6546548.1 ATP-binding cassette domain-containing protein [Dehalobacterium formicoaceticum]
MNNILEVKELKKIFTMKNGRKIEAVKNINFNVRRGEVFGFLGPNGAGKSTTISMLTTQKPATAGEILLDGESLIKNPANARRKIGVVAQHNNLDRGLTARENLIYHAKYFGMETNMANKKADEYLEKFGLADRQHDYVKSYSGGMAQRVKIARAMIHTPDILYLDEPTTGLDPSYRSILWEQMIELNKAGTTIFLTTHYMEEPEQLCDRIAIINNGELIALGTSSELKNMIPSNNIVSMKLSVLNDSHVESAKELPGVEKATIQSGLLQLYMKDAQPDFNRLVSWVKGLDTTLQNISLSTSTLDDVFIHLTGKGIMSNEIK